MPNISEMIESEVNALIFGDANDNALVAMPVEIAEQVIDMPHLSTRLRDWAWDTLMSELTE